MIVNLQLHNKTVIVVGGGTEGSRKVHGLLNQNCRIIVVTNRMNRYLSSQRSQQKISIIKSRLTDARIILDHFKNVFLIIAATNNKILNRTLVDRAREMHVFAYASDDPQYSDFSYLSLIHLGDGSQVGISTSGRSPIMSRRIRMGAERTLHKLHTLNNSTG
ncbi:MAG: precorrin-2 dehydrogenase/sirohydrochlorin ferrochelatase family protein [Nitrososphaeraceae archaeon]